MSTRFYPRFVKGNPQLRIFLPDWKMILVRLKNNSRHAMPDNIVSFKVDPRMTDWDIKNYLEKIYKIRVAAVNSVIECGEIKNTSKGITKEDDYRIAHVTLPLGEKFEWPDLFPTTKFKEALSDYDLTLKELNKQRKSDPNVKDVPTWFL